MCPKRVIFALIFLAASVAPVLGQCTGACQNDLILIDQFRQRLPDWQKGSLDCDGDGNTTVLDYVCLSQVIEKPGENNLAISLNSPIEGWITTQGEVEVHGLVNSDAERVEVNGVNAVIEKGSFSATLDLREGLNMIVAVAVDRFGRTKSASREVTRDIVAPTVRINTPSDTTTSASQVVDITGQVNDPVNGGTTASVQINGQAASVANGAFLLLGYRLQPGDNELEAVATDSVGNRGVHRIRIRYQEPVGARLSITGGNAQATTAGDTLPDPLAVRVTDDLGNPIIGRLVQFQVSRNNGQLQRDPLSPFQRTVEIATDANGEAMVWLTLGDTSGQGNNRVRAAALGVAGSVDFCASGLALAPDRILMVSGDSQRAGAGSSLPEPLTAKVVDIRGNPLSGVPVNFTVINGGGNLDGGARSIKVTDDEGLVRCIYTTGIDTGLNNNRVEATFEGLASTPAVFTSSALQVGQASATRLHGVVLDSSLTPIPEALITIDGSETEAITDSSGQFLLQNVPVGHIHVRIDPTNSPRPETFPPLEFEMVSIAGQSNTLGQPVVIPAIDTESSQIAGGDEMVTLTMAGVEGLSLEIFPHSTTFPDGSATGRISISQVQLDKVPMPPPGGASFMPPAWTIQPAGVIFDPPARITLPNSGLDPGSEIDLFQFDHAVNAFLDIGRGVVSDDGLTIRSDDGFGVTRSGWGGGGAPPPPVTCIGCPDPDDDGGDDPDDPDDEEDFCEDKPARILTPTITASHKVNDPLSRGVNKVLNLLGASKESKGTINVSFTRKERCCEEQELYPVVNKSVGVALKVSVDIAKRQIAGPGLPRPLNVGLGIFIKGSISGVLNGSGTYDACEDRWKLSGQGSLGARLTLSLEAKINEIASITPIALTTGVAGVAKLTTSNGEPVIKSGGTFLGVAIKSEVKFWDATITLVNAFIIQPSPLDDADLIITNLLD